MVNLRKLWIIIFVLSFLLTVEYFIYINHLFISFNLCIFLYLWLSFIYKIYGLKEFEDKYKKNYPIEFKFSIIYLCKIIIRGLTIKWLLLKKFVIKLWTKKLVFMDFLVFVTILIISFFIYKYHRNTFLIEIGSLLFYEYINIYGFSNAKLA